MISKNACYQDTAEAYYQVTEVGLQEHEKYNFQVVPNPTNDFVNIKGDFTSHATAELRDMTGRLIQQEILSSNNHRMELRHLPAGLYLLTIKDKKMQQAIPLQID